MNVSGLPVDMSARVDFNATNVTVVTYNSSETVNVHPTDVNVTEGGPTAIYDICLASSNPPSSIVEVNPSSVNGEVTVSPALAFDPATDDWKSVKSATVEAVDDDDAEGEHADTISHTSASTDPLFDGVAIPDVAVTITDNDAAGGVTLTVVNTLDDGPGSLRRALDISNGTLGVTETIVFDIPGGGVHTIQPLSPLPLIEDTVVIDGYTQPGAAANTLQVGGNATLLIEIDGSMAGPGADGLGIRDAGSSSVIRGLVINRFEGDGINIINSSNNTIEGNYVGTDPTGTSDLGNGRSGIEISETSVDNLIGCLTPDTRNVISGNGFGGVDILNSSSNVIQGNYIGTDRTGTQALPNRSGIFITGFSESNNIGGTEGNAGNLIAANRMDGVSLDDSARFNTVQGNEIRDNEMSGIFISGEQNSIGGDAATAGNLIASNDSNGITIDGGSDGNTVTGNEIRDNVANGVAVIGGPFNTILSNSLLSNGLLGIDLRADGVTPNDSADSDGGPNRLQNFPEFDGDVVLDTGSLIISYFVPTAELNAEYPLHVQFFLADADGQEGMTLLAESDYPAGLAEQIQMVVFDQGPVTAGDRIVATATDSDGNTSEFSSSAVVVESATFVVTNTNDSGPGSLRRAIMNANNVAGMNRIEFDIPGGGIQTIQLDTMLPIITDAVVIDATTQPGYNGTPVVNINGRNDIGTGFEFTSTDGLLQGISIHGFLDAGVRINRGIDVIGNVIFDNAKGVIIAGDGNQVQANEIRGNSGSGVLVDSANNNNISGNLISNNGGNGVTIVELMVSTNNSILSNSFSLNGGLAIDLDDDGQTPNDASDQDSGSNRLQNFPEFSGSVSAQGGELAFNFRVPSDPDHSTYPLTVQFFRADASSQEGDVFLGQRVYQESDAGQFTPTKISQGPAMPGDFIVATATDAAGNTSEFSDPVFIVANVPPSIAPPLDDAMIDEDTVFGPIAFTVDDDLTLPDELVLTATSNNQNLVRDSDIVLGGSGAVRTLQVTPLADAFGVATIFVTATDEGGLSTTDTFDLTVKPVSDGNPPLAVNDNFEVTDELGDISLITPSVLANDMDPDGDPLSVVDFDTVSALGATVASNGDGTFTYTHFSLAEFVDTFSYTIDDGNQNTAQATVIVDFRRLIEGDALEPDDNRDQATQLSSSRMFDGLTIHAARNDDWFKFTAEANGVLSAEATFFHQLGDLDLELYDADGNRVDFSDSVSNREQVGVDVLKGECYFIRAFSFVDQRQPGYKLTLVFDPDPIAQLVSPDADAPEIASSPQLSPGIARPVDRFLITFDKAVSGDDLIASLRARLTLTRTRNDTQTIDLASATLEAVDQRTFVLSGLGSLTGESGNYELRLVAAGSGIKDSDGNDLLGSDAVAAWTNIPGDANEDNRFDFLDLFDVSVEGKYLSDQFANWSQGDWNRDGRFDQDDTQLAAMPGHYEGVTVFAAVTDLLSESLTKDLAEDKGLAEDIVDELMTTDDGT